MSRRGWVGDAVAAANVAGARADLWLPGSLSALGYLAWLPLLVTVAGLPSESDLSFAGARLFSSGSFPLNVLLLASLAGLVVLVGCLVAALGEAVVLRATGAGTDRSLAHDTEVAFGVILIAALPALAALVAIGFGIAAVAPAEFAAPDTGAPAMLRVAMRLLPLLLLLVATVVVGQAFGAASVRRALSGSEVVGAALRGGLADVVRNPLRRLGIAAIGTLADMVAIVFALALLRILWAPIGFDLAAGRLVSPQALLLLTGFVAIWLALVLFWGALRAWTATWWSLELAAPPAAPEEET
ncbi:MAG: hypothetical protein WD116_03905 [Chloroflexota bacterium]